MKSPVKRFSEQENERLLTVFEEEISTKSVTLAAVRNRMKNVDFNVIASEKQIYDKVRNFIRSPAKGTFKVVEGDREKGDEVDGDINLKNSPIRVVRQATEEVVSEERKSSPIRV